jgi:hypothetical protein
VGKKPDERGTRREHPPLKPEPGLNGPARPQSRVSQPTKDMGQSAAPLRKVGQGRFSNVCSPKRLACFVRLITPAPKQLLQVLSVPVLLLRLQAFEALIVIRSARTISAGGK